MEVWENMQHREKGKLKEKLKMQQDLSQKRNTTIGWHGRGRQDVKCDVMKAEEDEEANNELLSRASCYSTCLH